MDETTGLKPAKTVSKMRLLVQAGLAIIIVDRWVMGLIKAVTSHKGPYLTVRPSRRMSPKAKQKEKSAMKKKIFGFTIATILGVGIIAVVAMKVWGIISAKIDAAKAASAPV